MCGWLFFMLHVLLYYSTRYDFISMSACMYACMYVGYTIYFSFVFAILWQTQTVCANGAFLEKFLLYLQHFILFGRSPDLLCSLHFQMHNSWRCKYSCCMSVCPSIHSFLCLSVCLSASAHSATALISIGISFIDYEQKCLFDCLLLDKHF